jgi:hypothetical protein
MAVVVMPTYSTQAVAGRHDIIEGRAVKYTDKGVGKNELHQVEYAKSKETGGVWVAICPPDDFKLPIQSPLYSATYYGTYNIKNPAIYNNPTITEKQYLTHNSEINSPTIIAQHGIIGLYKGLIGITPNCYVMNDPQLFEVKTPLVIHSSGMFTHKGNNDDQSMVVGYVEYYNKQTGILYILVH